MRIEKVYVNTHRYDLFFTRLCIVSVRYWYPDIPLFLIVDYSSGPFPSQSFCRKWSVQLLDTHKQKYGWGFGKFEPLFPEKREKFLVLDADTVMTGPVIDKLNEYGADFIVDKEVQPPEKLASLYYDPEKLADIWKDFTYPGYTFNTGQWVGTSGLLNKGDFADLVEWNPSPALIYPACFKQADQGIFNFLIHRKESHGQVSVDRTSLMVWPDNGAGDFIDIKAIRERRPDYPFVIHWAGMKFKRPEAFPRNDIMQFYLDYYYSRSGILQRVSDFILSTYLAIEKKIRRRLKR